MKVFTLQKDRVFAIPIIHYKMEMAAAVKLAFEEIRPDCVAVELAETMQLQLLHAASRLPDVSIVITKTQQQQPLYYFCEPCDGAFEGLRSALEAHIPAFCIDLDIDYYPDIHDFLPDAYAIQRIGLKSYYEAYQRIVLSKEKKVSEIDQRRELYMARRLKELSLSYDRILFVSGMYHAERVLDLIDLNSFPPQAHASREIIEIQTITEESCREVMAECGWMSSSYEESRQEFMQKISSNPKDLASFSFPPDRQKLIFQIYKEASVNYMKNTGNAFPGYHMRNLMKFVRNYALLHQQLMPDLFQLLTAAKGCVDHNFAYEVWELATRYSYRKNIDGLFELSLTGKDVWGHSKIIHFHLQQKGRKSTFFRQRRKDRSQFRFSPPGLFSICSYPPEDLIIERFGEFLKKKGTQLLTDESARTAPFSASIEDGIDTKETIRHWTEKKLYVKVKGKPPGGVGSVVMIFDEDKPEEDKSFEEKYPWRTTWLGEHTQESDMAFYSTSIATHIVGPGISRCEYGGFMMSYPPRRMFDVWSDSDYQECRTKAEVLLLAAIDYAIQPLIVYVASSPPRSVYKSIARRFSKKLVYIPIGQLSPITLNKIRVFHVLDSHDRRNVAGEYIF